MQRLDMMVNEHGIPFAFDGFGQGDDINNIREALIRNMMAGGSPHDSPVAMRAHRPSQNVRHSLPNPDCRYSSSSDVSPRPSAVRRSTASPEGRVRANSTNPLPPRGTRGTRTSSPPRGTHILTTSQANSRDSNSASPQRGRQSAAAPRQEHRPDRPRSSSPFFKLFRRRQPPDPDAEARASTAAPPQSHSDHAIADASTAATATATAETVAQATQEPVPQIDSSIVWGSFERLTGAWCPYAETNEIEFAYQSGRSSIHLPNCFGATVHFETPFCCQRTPAVNGKPAGFRSVLRGLVGQTVMIFWDPQRGLYTLEHASHLDAANGDADVSAKEVTIHNTLPTDLHVIWQWCDLVGDDVMHAREGNWHDYAPADSREIEYAWGRRLSEVEICIGVTAYRIHSFRGSYATQYNLRTHSERLVRRSRVSHANVQSASPFADDVCGLCTEKFGDTPLWPVSRTLCRHLFHDTCIKQVLFESEARRKCPICRLPLEESLVEIVHFNRIAVDTPTTAG
mmetsp:Transcript_22238/g.43255  ORF Transcript_22238/g.43255 Transcript_22238/m.43255 type:complete len:512 (-) Transcript_22238:939-2474(-)